MTHKLNKSLANRTRIACIVGACLLLVVIPGLILNILAQDGINTGIVGIQHLIENRLI